MTTERLTDEALRADIAKAIYDKLEGPIANQDFKRQQSNWALAQILADAAIAAWNRRATPADDLREALEPFAGFARASGFDKLPDDLPMTQGSRLARRQVTAGDFKRALAILSQKGDGGRTTPPRGWNCSRVRARPVRRGLWTRSRHTAPPLGAALC